MKPQDLLDQILKVGRPLRNWIIEDVWRFLTKGRHPRYVRDGKVIHKSVQRFVNYRKDLLKPEVLEEIQSLNAQLDTAIKASDEKGVEKATERLTEVCKKAAPRDYRASALAENIEVIFVALAIALGIRAYIAQPFKIPTGSMQPTLNGIVAYGTDIDQPNSIVKAIDSVRLGRTWVDSVIKEDDVIVDIEEFTRFKFFTYTRVIGEKNTYVIHAPAQQAYLDLGIGKLVRASYSNGNWWVMPSPVEEGDVLARGYVDTGDQVIVDKFSYHFIPPKRGEVFVFTTEDIRGIAVNPPEMGSIHYIKRLAGLPGDEISIRDGNIYVNGELGEEFGFRRVMSKENGYRGYFETHKFELKDDQYLALGDNSGNSQDSRSWGHVPQDNLVGRALFVYWPFNRHWGVIR